MNIRRGTVFVAFVVLYALFFTFSRVSTFHKAPQPLTVDLAGSGGDVPVFSESGEKNGVAPSKTQALLRKDTTSPTNAPKAPETPAPTPAPPKCPLKDIYAQREFSNKPVSSRLTEFLNKGTSREIMGAIEASDRDCGDGLAGWPFVELVKRHYEWGYLKEFTDRTYFIAGMLHNNEDVLPFYMREVLKLCIFLGRGNVFVSIYESDSRDKTKEYLSWFRELLNMLAIPNQIVLDMYSKVGQQRIPFLAQCRNRALFELKDLMTRGECVHKVLFLNDIFFCAKLDALELLRVDGDLVCGTDWVFAGDGTRLSEADMAVQRLEFYDSWVSVDINGENFSGRRPHVKDEESKMAFLTERPFQVFSCWNGMVSIDPDVFWLGLSFRFAEDGECKASECQLFARDIWRLGRNRIGLVPRVRTAYTRAVFDRLWLDYPSRGSESQIDLRSISYSKGPPDTLDCYPLLPNKMAVNPKDHYREIFNITRAN